MVCDGLNKLLHSKISVPAATVKLYNGNVKVYKGSFFKQQHHNGASKKYVLYLSTYDLMKLCADALRLSSSIFPICLLYNQSSKTYILPYNKNVASSTDAQLEYRIIYELDRVKDLSHCDPDTFSYIYHQNKMDIYELIKTSQHIEKISDFLLSSVGLILAISSKRFGVNCNHFNIEKLTRLYTINHAESEVVSYIMRNITSIVDKVLDFLLEYETARDCEYAFIMLVKPKIDMFKPIKNVFSVSRIVDTEKADPYQADKSGKILCSDQGLSFCNTNYEILPYEEIKKIRLNEYRKRSFEIILKNSASIFKVSFLPDKVSEMESCLALMDLYYRKNVKARMLIQPYNGNHFDQYSMIFNDLDPANISLNFYNIMDKCKEPIEFLSVKRGPQILKDLGFYVGWYILFQLPTPNVYRLTIVLSSGPNAEKILHSMKICYINGFYSLYEKKSNKKSISSQESIHRYQSIPELMEGIKIKVCNKKLTITPTVCVTEEMVMDIREDQGSYASHTYHKQPHILSLHCLNFSHNSVYKEVMCSISHGTWHSPLGIKNGIRSFIYSYKFINGNILGSIEDLVKGISKPNFTHENILKCFGLAQNRCGLYLIFESFGVPFPNTFRNYSDKDLFEFGNQIKTGLLFLHNQDIVHGFPALHNIYIDQELKHVKIAKIGVLSSVLRGTNTSNQNMNCALDARGISVKFPELYVFLCGWFSKKRINRIQLSEEVLDETWDRYVFGCTLWQLYNNGAVPLSNKTDQEILEKLESNDGSWFNGGSYFKLPSTKNTEFHKKLQKIINVCVTWGNKDNQEKYEFSKIAEAYEKLGDVVQNQNPTDSEYFIKAGDGVLDFDVSNPEMNNVKKYTYVEKKGEEEIIIINNKENNLDQNIYNNKELKEFQEELHEKGCLLSLHDLQQPDGSDFKVPAPGSKEVEAVCKKFTFSQKIWVKSFSRSKDVPEQDFMEEVKNLLKFQHPNIVPLKGCIIQDESLLLLTPLYKFGSLRDYLDNNSGDIEDEQRESFAHQICSGMNYLSENNCIHRDLRLAHVYIAHRNKVIISNFGLSRVTESLYYQQHRHINSDTFVVYPPEVISILSKGGKVKFTRSCDVWSYGVLLWELYQGDIAYHNLIMDMYGEPSLDMLDQFLSAGNSLDLNDTWPNHIINVISKCLSHELPRITFHDIEVMLNK